MDGRKRFVMSDDDLTKLLEAMQPALMIMLQCGPAPTRQERANDAWAELGRRMGFDHMSVRPVKGEPQTVFTAVPKQREQLLTSREGR